MIGKACQYLDTATRN